MSLLVFVGLVGLVVGTIALDARQRRRLERLDEAARRRLIRELQRHPQ